MLRPTLLALLFATVSSRTSAATLEELNQRRQPLPTVAEKDLPPLKNKPEPFTGIVRHPGLQASTWVRFPFVENPGSFGFDRKGRLFVAEANRFWQGAPDLRGANELIRGDFQSRTVADRAKLYETFASRFPATFFTDTADRIIRLEDRDGNGAADHRTLFSDRFHAPLDGIGFSLLAEDDGVYFTCIPNLWKLTDANDDGVADDAKKLVEGFGVRVSFIGHDLHGITRGPDGRLYFSVGDRGFHVTTANGRVLTEPGRGAIFRCESDGSGFEVFCKGLRNPQELAFDEAGNLFTFDNTGDIGDKARMVYALEGSDSGWDMAHQSAHHYVTMLDWEDLHPDTSVWVTEKMYDTFNPDQPQWVYPPASHVAQGPSGVTWLSGDSLPPDLRGTFLLANYLGAARGCDVLTVGIAARGAGYQAVSEKTLAEGVGVSDVELGYDGNIWLCDFGGGWSVNTSGAIHRLTPQDEILKKAGADAQAIFAKGVKEDSTAALLNHLTAPDKRLRQLAQFELVKRNDLATLAVMAKDASQPVRTRLHGLWGMDELGRKGAPVAAPLLSLTKDPDPEIRANAARTLGSIRVRVRESRDALLTLLRDESPRVRSLSAIALGRIAEKGDAAVIAGLYLTAENQGPGGPVDPVLRHSVLSALDLLGTVEAAIAQSTSPNMESRLIALLQLRRHSSPEAARFLTDSDPLVRREAIRAIYDTAALDGPAGDAVAALTKESTALPIPLQQRIIAANYRRGTPENARNLLAMAGDATLDAGNRARAVHALRLWEKQITTDPVLGHYRPQPKADRSMAALGQAIGSDLRRLFADELPPQLAALALKLADESSVPLGPATLKAYALNPKLADEVRTAALGSLVRAVPADAPALVSQLTEDPSATVAAAALAQGYALKMDNLADISRRAITNGPLEKARAALTGLSASAPAEITALWQNRETNGLRRELWLDLFLALQTSADTNSKSLATNYAATGMEAVFRLSETGGDRQRGEKVFRNQGGCLQCHKMGPDGGIQGPDLTRTGERLTASKLVESLVNPNAEITEGYGLAAITLKDGNLVMGRITRQTAEEVQLMGIDGKSSTVAAGTIASIAPPVSAMPPLGMSLPPRDLRDLVAYLATRNTASMGPASDDSSHGDKAKEKISK